MGQHEALNGYDSLQAFAGLYARFDSLLPHWGSHTSVGMLAMCDDPLGERHFDFSVEIKATS